MTGLSVWTLWKSRDGLLNMFTTTVFSPEEHNRRSRQFNYITVKFKEKLAALEAKAARVDELEAEIKRMADEEALRWAKGGLR